MWRYSKICKKHLRGDITRTIVQFDTLSYYVLLIIIYNIYWYNYSTYLHQQHNSLKFLMSTAPLKQYQGFHEERYPNFKLFSGYHPIH